MNDEADINETAYAAYADWKQWQGEHDLSVMNEMYGQDIQRGGIKPGAEILEVGFGNGDFLAWARRAGFKVVGIEINPTFVASAAAQNFDVRCGAVTDNDFEGKTFDAVVAWDVLEHLTKTDILQHLRAYQRLLKSGGVVVARFPNAASPFGIWAQAGDITHQTGLTGDAMLQLAMLAGFEIVYSGNAARSLRGGKRKGMAVVKWLVYRIRDFIEIFFGLLYFGKRVPLDMNMTVAMKRIN